jgi:hypothetical protein
MEFPEYHKINSLYKRDQDGKFLTEWSDDTFGYLYDTSWLFTEKVDGTNIRIGYDHETGAAQIGGRTERAQVPAHLLEALFPIVDDVVRLGPDLFSADVVLYGEGYGPKIQQGGGNYGDVARFVLFDVLIGGFWLRRQDVEGIAGNLGLRTVPLLMVSSLRDAEKITAEGFDSTWGSFPAEGMVGVPTTPLRNRRGDRVITKLKTKDYK